MQKLILRGSMVDHEWKLKRFIDCIYALYGYLWKQCERGYTSSSFCINVRYIEFKDFS
jgi:hypothetical protein